MAAPLHYVFEDRTGQSTSSDWDEIYDRLYLRVAPSPTDAKVLNVYTMNQRASRHRDSLPFERTPSIVLDFNRCSGDFGMISFIQKQGPMSGAASSISLSRYLRKTSMFGSSLSRKFTGSDSHEYRWSFRGGIPGREWTCTNGENHIIAHFDLKPPGTRAYKVSGNSFTIGEAYAPLSIELLASLTAMRYIAENNL